MNGGSYSGKSNYQLDFTKLTDQFNKKLSSYFQSEIEYDKSDLNQRYEFAWMDDVTDLFGGNTIDVKSNYIQKDKTEEINIGQFSSDVDYMLFNPSNFSEDGFALLCPIKQKQSVIINVYDQANNVGFIKTNGTSISVDDHWRYTDYISVSPGQTIDCILQGHTAISSVTFYNASREVLQTNVASTNNEKIERTFTAPANSAFVRICGGNPGWSNQTYKQYANTPEFIDVLNLPIITVNGLVDENKDIYTAVAQNWYASWIYLQNFYLWDMPAYSIESNVLNYLYARDIKKCMKHTIEFPTEEDLDELELIKTAFGNGKIDEISISLDTRIAKVNLLYKPE